MRLKASILLQSLPFISRRSTTCPRLGASRTAACLAFKGLFGRTLRRPRPTRMPQKLQQRGSQASKLRLSLEPAAYGHLGSATARLEALPQGHTPKRSLRVEGLARHPPSFGARGGLFCWAQARREAVKRALSSHVRATTKAKASKTFVGRKQLDRNSREFGRFNIHCLGACKRQTQSITHLVVGESAKEIHMWMLLQTHVPLC